jgi:hypothetical protein
VVVVVFATVVVVPPPALVVAAGTALGVPTTAADFGTETPTPIKPFMPAAAWPGTVQRNSYFPAFVSVSVRVAD